MVQHYFASAWMQAGRVKRDCSCKVDTNLAAVGMINSVGEAPGAKAVDARLFAGPQVEKTLESMTPAWSW